jgi:hypothetical protein
MTSKICNTCGKVKSLTNFHKDKKARDGHKNKCKPCTNTSFREYYRCTKTTEKVVLEAVSDSPEETYDIAQDNILPPDDPDIFDLLDDSGDCDILRKKREPGAFYIISNPSYIDINHYKIGKTCRTERDIATRYRTYFLKPIVLYYREVGKKYEEHEHTLKQILEPYRVKNDIDNVSEFVQMPLQDLIDEVDKYFAYVEKFERRTCKK